MTRRALLIILLLAALLVVAVWLLRRHEERKTELRRPPNLEIARRQPETKGAAFTPRLEQTRAEATQIVEIVQTAAPTPSTEKKDAPHRTYRLIGNGGYPAKVIDDQGKVVIEANPNFGIHGVSISPNNDRLLVLGYPMSLVVELTTDRRIALPSQPPGSNKLGFASWRWIDNDFLLGESGDAVAERKPGAGGEGNNVAQTRLYLYDLNRQGLEEVKLPDDLVTKVFSVTEVSPDGSVHLIHDDPSATRPPDLGWFKVRGN